ncbi:hypothetical protein M2322_003411 [Rhodoblastus acidophilus]|uniref:Ig-like domain-containing protein n=1 Tax=Rhodoblastus acidophilus TaxID=1074 RepID=UPI0022256667|nr:Ig-like domain-containing protein [Rhodoblastus acidophilus]MCW2317846.1 hypothetical protein [Rhodoblastus acidophilus]
MNISGTVYVYTPNVTISHCKITSANFAVVQIAGGVTGTTVKNCEINGTDAHNDGSHGINGQGTFVGNNIYNVENGINVTGPSTIQDNYIHDLKASGEPHSDGIQIDGGVSNTVVIHNTIINAHEQTAAVMMDNDFGAVSNIKVDNNILSGGGYTVCDDAHFNGSDVTGVSFSNNHMESGRWGYTDLNADTPVYSGNVNDGAALIAKLNTPANTGSGSTGTTTPRGATGGETPPTDSGSGAGTGTGTDSGSHTTPGSPPATRLGRQGACVDITDLSAGGWAHAATINGVADANSHINIFDGKTQIGSATTDSGGHWTFKTAPLSNAVHTFTATEVDNSGHVAAKSSGAATLGTRGHDTLTSTFGADVFVGSGHPDTFVFASHFGHDVINDFGATGWRHDTIQFSAPEFADFASVLSHAQQVGSDVLISSGHDQLTLKHTSLGALSAHDFHFA